MQWRWKTKSKSNWNGKLLRAECAHLRVEIILLTVHFVPIVLAWSDVWANIWHSAQCPAINCSQRCNRMSNTRGFVYLTTSLYAFSGGVNTIHFSTLVIIWLNFKFLLLNFFRSTRLFRFLFYSTSHFFPNKKTNHNFVVNEQDKFWII